MLTIRAMSDGKGYSTKHLEHSDYYAEGEKVVGRWQGRAAELLGLAGEVRTEEFDLLRQGFHPSRGEFLRQRHSADRVNGEGEVESHGRHLYDFTVSAPKSISVMAIVGGDERLVAAHQRAVSEMIRELEAHAATRVRINGANADRSTGNVAVAVYDHDTSRELDPQLHTHVVAANLTFDGEEGRWKALQASSIYERRAYLTEVYRNALAREVRLLGYDVENRRDAKGHDCGFEIRGVAESLLERFSQRSKQRDAAIDEFTRERGRKPTDNEVAVLVRESRADKLIAISTEDLRSKQLGRVTSEEFSILHAVGSGRGTGKGVELRPASASLEYAEEHVFERVSVARDHEILTEALRHGRGEIGHAELKGMLAMQEASGAILRDGGEIATRASLEREREIVGVVNRGVGACARMGGGEPFIASDRLNPEQKRAVQFVLESRDRAVSISGAAGTGKTATLQELRRGLSDARREILAVAPTMSAVEELQNVGFGGAMTVERLLRDEAMQNSLSGKVVILDEAGMVSARQMAEFLRLVERFDARVVFTGDTKQIQSVEAGDSLRILEKESRLKTVSLTEVRRQTVKGYRDAIKQLRADPERGFAKLEAIGAVKEVAAADRAREVANAYAEAAKGRQRNVLVVCPTHEEIERVTDAIRVDRKATGKLAPGIQTHRDVPLNWTAAQKTDSGNFRRGQILVFHREVKGIRRNEPIEVVRVEGKHVIGLDSSGAERKVSGKQASAFNVFESRQMEVGKGDRLLLASNRRDAGFKATNGELVTVADFESQGRIRLEDGRTIPADYRQFAHGYAVTAHRSQGKSVDAVIISGDGMRKELFYVAASRGRESVQVITSDKETLRENVARSTARKSATELARAACRIVQRGEFRGIRAAMSMARRHRDMSRLEPVPAAPAHLGRTKLRERTHERGFSR